MATCLAHLTRSMRLIGVLQEGEQPNANQTSDGLRALETMLGAFEGEGVPMGTLVGSTLTAATVLPVPATHDEAIQTNLALRLAPEYGVMPSPLLMDRAATTFATLQGQYADDIPMTVEPALLRGGMMGRWGIDG